MWRRSLDHVSTHSQPEGAGPGLVRPAHLCKPHPPPPARGMCGQVVGHLLSFRAAPTAESKESSPELHGSAQSLSLAPL